ncbi:zinc ribbon domain-containing protein [Natrialba swarupiae]|nr:zinc ribbon domain-containing protein [Natrialba swarupiae]
MSRYEFTCPDCGQTIEVNEEMREATLAHGCPVCGADVTGPRSRQTNRRAGRQVVSPR